MRKAEITVDNLVKIGIIVLFIFGVALLLWSLQGKPYDILAKIKEAIG